MAPFRVFGGAAPYELGATRAIDLYWTAMFPVFVRGEAYLAARRGSEAAAEFQKILDHRGLVLNQPIGALAHLAGVYCECSPETLRIPSKSFHPYHLNRFLRLGIRITPYILVYL